MDQIQYYLYWIFGKGMYLSWAMVKNYGWAIIVFTLLTKIIMMPISVWIQKNSILMVKIQPEVNFLKANTQGNLDAQAEGQQKIFKRVGYHPLISIIPLILQIVLLLAVVYIIYHPLGYLLKVSDSNIKALADYIGVSTSKSSFQLNIMDAIKDGTINSSSVIPGVTNLDSIISKVNRFDNTIFGVNLSVVPSKAKGWYLIVPVLAALSSFVMCWTQNISNVLQKEQSKANQYGIMGISVALSLYLGLGVPVGIGTYWIASNLISIGVMYLLNFCINPKKYVDYQALEESREALKKAKEFGALNKNDETYKAAKKKEKEDFKAFKKIANKHIVFYSEKSGFYKYFKDLIKELLAKSNLNIHYVTNDYNDQIFEIAKEEPRIKPYYISLKKTVTLMMLVECDMFVMTTPDLNNFYLKRSFLKKDINYVYVPHDMMSVTMSFHENAFDSFDTMLCAGPHIKRELEELETINELKKKKLVEFGYPLADYLVEMGAKENENREIKEKKDILIAPSWSDDNILDSCIDDLIEGLYSDDYHIIVRPHPEYVKRYKYKMDSLVEKYKDYDPEKLTFELDFTVNKSIYSSEIIISDWSGVAPEFAFATQRPVVFINTQMKCENPNWQKVKYEPVEITLRNQIGVSLDKDKCNTIKEVIDDLIKKEPEYETKIKEVYKGHLYNQNDAANQGAKALLKILAIKELKKCKE